MKSDSPTAAPGRALTSTMVYRWPLTLVLGALAVALAAQFAVPLPLTPVPMSLQALAVILVGGLVGAAAGTGAMVLYLVAGAFGAPVFAGGAAGLPHLIGPSGGYLLAFPLAAAVTGTVGRRGNLGHSMLAALLGMVTIHAGGLAQLTLLGGSFRAAFAAGTAPFLLVDSLKVVIGGLVLWRGQGAFRPRA
jgi:biotin transport system substrate-specific component